MPGSYCKAEWDMDCKGPGWRFAKTPFVDASYREKPFLLSSRLDPRLKRAFSEEWGCWEQARSYVMLF